jgi:hypothetical protein
MGQGLLGPTGLLAHSAHLARLIQPARVWVGQTDPAQPSLALPSPSRARWRSGSPPSPPGHSGHLRWPLPPMLGQNGRLHFLYQLLQLESAEISPPRRSGWCSPSETAATNRLRFGASPCLPSRACCATSGAWVARELAGGSAVVWCSRWVLDEVNLG